jgi:hypothetical protein
MKKYKKKRGGKTESTPIIIKETKKAKSARETYILHTIGSQEPRNRSLSCKKQKGFL